MKKTFRMIGMALCAVLLAVGMTACGSDDDDPFSPQIPDLTEAERAVFGSWQTLNFDDELETLDLYGDYTFKQEVIYEDGVEKDSGTFDYDHVSHILYLDYDGGGVVSHRCFIKDHIMELYYGNKKLVYYRQ